MAGPLARTPQQMLAADPARHVWVAASAGTGKTHVLTDRILRLLLAGCPPDRILALTFTRAAAAEMQNRILSRLADWAALADAALAAELLALGVAADGPALQQARRLFPLALDVPGGLRIHTLHAFAEGLLAAFPLEAGLAPGFEALDEGDGKRLRREALQQAIADASAEGDTGFLDNLAQLSIAKGESSLLEAVDALVDAGDALLAFRDPEGLRAAVRRWLQVDDEGQLQRQLAPGGFDEGPARALLSCLQGWDTASGRDLADRLAAWLALDATDRVPQLSLLAGVVMVGKEKPRSFKQAEKSLPGIAAAADALFAQVEPLVDWQRALATADLAGRMLAVGQRILSCHEQLKRAAGAIDFHDMIARTVALLGPEGRPGYVGWKLDSRFDHVLVDEAQDTNADQWRIIGRLIEEFWSGADDRRRRLFVVGDYKQAIYGFQGTDPDVFESWHDRIAPAVAAAGAPLADVDLALSFRSGPAVLEVVNGVLGAIGGAALGMQRAPRPHQPHRATAGGEVVLWPPVVGESDDEGESAGVAASRELARRLARQVAAWLRPGDPERLWLPARRRFAEAGDILVLLRRRTTLMAGLVAALHEEGVRVSGVDRLLLMEPLAVLDLVALVRFAVQPEDDLVLATLLVSPFLGWAHEEVRQLGGGRPGLWAALGRKAAGNERALAARQWLSAVLALADRVGPYEFLDTILSGPLQGRRLLVARLGAQANDPIDELLNQALLYEQRHAPALASFLAWIEAEGVSVRRDAEAAGGQVRLMTVHGAKGLEAPVVVLADAASERRGRQGPLQAEIPGAGRLPIWYPPAAGQPQQIVRLLHERAARDEEEETRLLYVALTRAADHLYLTGSVGPKGQQALAAGKSRSWYALVERVLAGRAGVVRRPGHWFEGEALVLRRGEWSDPDAAAPLAPAPARHPTSDLALGPAPDEERPPRPLTPSASPEPPPEGPARAAMEAAARRGTLAHALFQRLPLLPAGERAAAGRAFLVKADAGAELESILGEVLAVLEDPRFQPLFAPDALTEAPIAGLVGERAILGVVDRLLVADDRVQVIDYKTGRRVPEGAADTPLAHRRQMAAYAAVLRRAFPGRGVEALLLYTAGPRLIALADDDLEDLLA